MKKNPYNIPNAEFFAISANEFITVSPDIDDDVVDIPVTDEGDF